MKVFSDINHVIEKSDVGADSSDRTGRLVWPSSVVLVAELGKIAGRTNSSLRGVKILELAGGPGLCSLAAASIGADVLYTDVAPDAIESVRLAAKNQDFVGSLVYQSFDILNDDAPLPVCDLLLASDCLYDKKLAAGVARRCVEAAEAGAGFLVVSPFGRSGECRFNSVLKDEFGKSPLLQSSDGGGAGEEYLLRVPSWEETTLPAWAANRWPRGSADGTTQVS